MFGKKYKIKLDIVEIRIVIRAINEYFHTYPSLWGEVSIKYGILIPSILIPPLHINAE